MPAENSPLNLPTFKPNKHQQDWAKALYKDVKLPTPTAKDYLKLVGAGGVGTVGGLTRAADVLTGGTVDLGVSEYLGEGAAQLRESVSPAMRRSMGKKFIEDGKMGEAWTDPHAVGGMLAESIVPSVTGIIPALKAASVVGKAAAAKATVKALQGGATQKTAMLAGQKAGQRAGQVAAIGTGSSLEGAIAGGMSANELNREIMSMSPEALEQHPKYIDLISKGVSPEQARRQLAESATRQAFLTTAPAVGLTAVWFNQFLGRLATRGAAGGRLGGSRLRAAGTGLGLEAGTEAVQSGAERALYNVALQKYADPTRETGDDVLNAIISGTIAGGIMGGAVGGVMGGAPQAAPEVEGQPPTQEQPAPVTDQWQGWTPPGQAPQVTRQAGQPQRPPLVETPVLKKAREQYEKVFDESTAANEKAIEAVQKYGEDDPRTRTFAQKALRLKDRLQKTLSASYKQVVNERGQPRGQGLPIPDFKDIGVQKEIAKSRRGQAPVTPASQVDTETITAEQRREMEPPAAGTLEGESLWGEPTTVTEQEFLDVLDKPPAAAPLKAPPKSELSPAPPTVTPPVKKPTEPEALPPPPKQQEIVAGFAKRKQPAPVPPTAKPTVETIAAKSTRPEVEQQIRNLEGMKQEVQDKYAALVQREENKKVGRKPEQHGPFNDQIAFWRQEQWEQLEPIEKGLRIQQEILAKIPAKTGKQALTEALAKKAQPTATPPVKKPTEPEALPPPPKQQVSAEEIVEGFAKRKQPAPVPPPPKTGKKVLTEALQREAKKRESKKAPAPAKQEVTEEQAEKALEEAEQALEEAEEEANEANEANNAYLRMREGGENITDEDVADIERDIEKAKTNFDKVQTAYDKAQATYDEVTATPEQQETARQIIERAQIKKRERERERERLEGEPATPTEKPEIKTYPTLGKPVPAGKPGAGKWDKSRQYTLGYKKPISQTKGAKLETVSIVRLKSIESMMHLQAPDKAVAKSIKDSNGSYKPIVVQRIGMESYRLLSGGEELSNAEEAVRQGGQTNVNAIILEHEADWIALKPQLLKSEAHPAEVAPWDTSKEKEHIALQEGLRLTPSIVRIAEIEPISDADYKRNAKRAESIKQLDHLAQPIVVQVIEATTPNPNKPKIKYGYRVLEGHSRLLEAVENEAAKGVRSPKVDGFVMKTPKQWDDFKGQVPNKGEPNMPLEPAPAKPPPAKPTTPTAKEVLGGKQRGQPTAKAEAAGVQQPEGETPTTERGIPPLAEPTVKRVEPTLAEAQAEFDRTLAEHRNALKERRAVANDQEVPFAEREAAKKLAATTLEINKQATEDLNAARAREAAAQKEQEQKTTPQEQPAKPTPKIVVEKTPITGFEYVAVSAKVEGVDGGKALQGKRAGSWRYPINKLRDIYNALGVDTSTLPVQKPLRTTSMRIAPEQVIPTLPRTTFNENELHRAAMAFAQMGGVLNPPLLEEVEPGEYEVIQGNFEAHVAIIADKLYPSRDLTLNAYGYEAGNELTAQRETEGVIHSISEPTTEIKPSVADFHGIVQIEDINPAVPREQFSDEEIEAGARDFIKHGGVLNPPVLLRTADDAYDVITGNREYYIAARAVEIKPSLETVNAFALNKRQLEQLRIEREQPQTVKQAQAAFDEAKVKADNAIDYANAQRKSKSPYTKATAKAAQEEADAALEELKTKEDALKQAAVEKAVSPPNEKVAAQSVVAGQVAKLLEDNKIIDRKHLIAIADKAFGRSQARGGYLMKEAYDALELGINLHLRSLQAQSDFSFADIAKTLKRLKNKILERIPTQSTRSQKQVEMQQFSTPPTHSYLAAWVANIDENDVILEPSAGVGSLVTAGLNANPNEVYGNELDPGRADLLRQIPGISGVFTENAEHLDNVLPDEVKPTVILMNPPFSAAANKPGAKVLGTDAKHVEQALKRLEEGGRLVAIVGRGLAPDRALAKKFWARVGNQYTVKANIGIPGKEYAKYGTSFDNRLLVIDKVTPARGQAPLVFEAENVENAAGELQEIHDDRLHRARTEPRASEPELATQPSEPESPPAGRGGTRPEQSVRDTTGTVGAGERTGGMGRGKTEPTRTQPEYDRGPEKSIRGDEGIRRVTGRPGEPSGVSGAVGTEPPSTTGGRPRTTREPSGVSKGGRSKLPRADVVGKLQRPSKTTTKPRTKLTESKFDSYQPAVTMEGSKPHPDPLVESAAMASIVPPEVSYVPNLPSDVIESGALSSSQLETVIRAGEAHQQTLPTGERRGFFNGDGTGSGKGAQAAGIIYDNWRQGRRKAVWLSEKPKLIKDAKRDLDWVGLGGGHIINHGSKQYSGGKDIHNKEGVLFSNYKMLISTTAAEREKKEADSTYKPITRVEQIVKWLGKDFDGVIIFDEAHNMKNSLEIGTGLGKKKPAQQALAGIDLQRALPNARVVYFSATAASDVYHLGYADRLGLWGENTAFSSKEKFVQEITNGGVAAMEVVAKDMKAGGMYVSRSLSYDDVTYETLTHKLSKSQISDYNTMTKAWQIVLSNIDNALEITGNDKGARNRALSSFWGSHQRFFSQVLVASQVPALIKDAEAHIGKGDSIVIQLVNTNEAPQERKLAAAAEEDIPLDDINMSPIDILMEHIRDAFPVAQYEEYIDVSGNTRTRAVKDSKGNPVLNKEAVQARDNLIMELGALRVPENALDQIINHFRPDEVAEITGRSKRLVRDAAGTVTQQTLTDNTSNADADAFMNDEKRILIFSDAGGTGRSYHADLREKNQRKRIHYLLQPGWKADQALQGMGRTHRTNQKQAPHYILVTTNLKSQARFISTIAKRLTQLGALTKGQRDTASQGVISAEQNLENEYAEQALEVLIMDIHGGRVEGLTMAEFEEQTALAITDESGNLTKKKVPIKKFLNRMLSLNIDTMNTVFDAFFERLQAQVQYAKERGTYDEGMETIHAKSIKLVDDQIVADKEGETHYVRLELKHPTIFTQYDALPKDVTFARQANSEHLYAIMPAVTVTDTKTGEILERVRRISPTSSKYVSMAELEKKYERLGKGSEIIRAEWDKVMEETSKDHSETKHMITGSLLPVWNRLPKGTTKIYRAQTDEGQIILGRDIPTGQIDETLTALGVTVTVPNLEPAQWVSRVMDNNETLDLANGWKIKRSRVAEENRLEVVGASLPEMTRIQKRGGNIETIRYSTRLFVPHDRPDILNITLENNPVVKVHYRGEEVKFALRAEPLPSEPVSIEAISDVTEQVARAWNNAPARIQIAEAFENLPQGAQQAATEQGATPDQVRGIFYQGTQYLVRSNIGSAQEVEEVLFHEALHDALATRHESTSALRGAMNTLLIRMGGQAGLTQLAQQNGVNLRQYQENTKDLPPRARNAVLVEELLANIEGARAYDTLPQRVKRAIREFWGKVRSWLAQHGFTNLASMVGINLNNLNDADIAYLLKDLRQGLSASDILGGRTNVTTAPVVADEHTRPIEARLALKDTLTKTGAWKSYQAWKTFGPKRLSWWDKSLGTMYNIAEKHPAFKKVFDIGQDFLSDVSAIAVEAETKANHIFRQFSSWKQARTTGRAKKADIDVASNAVYKGTLRDEKVYTNAELRSKFGLSDEQIRIYHQARDAAETSIDSLTKSAVFRLARTLKIDQDAAAELAKGNITPVDYLAELSRQHIMPLMQASTDVDERKSIKATLDMMGDFVTQAEGLKDRGYFPLMRFGRYTVDVIDKKTGEREYFSMFESATEADQMAKAFESPDVTVTTGIMSKQAWKLYPGLSPDVIESFARITGLDQSDLFQDYLRLAVKNQSALKRLIERKKIPGFSTDLSRTLANFIVSNARLASTNYNLGKMRQGIEALTKGGEREKGQLADQAVNLWDYLTHPTEEFAKFRGFLFFHFLGGSIASAAVNLTQVPMVTSPYLHQFGGDTTKTILKWANPKRIPVAGSQHEADLRKGEERGIVAPQEIYQLMATAQGGVLGAGKVFGSKKMQTAMHIWGSMFSAAEQYNRRVTFNASYEIAQEKGQQWLSDNGFKNAYEFAVKAVNETQFIYNRGNRPRWARGIGAPIFTFKQFSISYLEFLGRLPRKQRAIAGALLVLAAGAGGLPFKEDIEDIIDTIGQWMGYNANTRKGIEDAAHAVLGETLGGLATHGVTGLGIPLDIHSRLSMANLVPGTAMLKPSTTDKKREVLDVFGAGGGLLQSMLHGTESAFRGDMYTAGRSILPKAIRNLGEGMDMLSSGVYKDFRGRTITDVSTTDAFIKMIGFHPSKVANLQRNKRMLQTTINLHRIIESGIADKWARGIVNKDKNAVANAVKDLTKWNKRNPDMPIVIQRSQIVRRVNMLQMSARERFLKATPTELRSLVAEY